MFKIRKINRVWQSKPTLEGAGVSLHRAFGYDQVPQFDPFLLLDDFRGDDPADYLKGFPGGRPVDDGRQRHHSSGDA
jgi:redox-sensitive bicupin YhaK (pirin superfamily)